MFTKDQLKKAKAEGFNLIDHFLCYGDNTPFADISEDTEGDGGFCVGVDFNEERGYYREEIFFEHFDRALEFAKKAVAPIKAAKDAEEAYKKVKEEFHVE